MAGFSDMKSFTNFEDSGAIRITEKSGFQSFTDRETDVYMLMQSAEIFDSNKGEGTEITRIRYARSKGNETELYESTEDIKTKTDYEEIFPLELTVEHSVKVSTVTFTNQTRDPIPPSARKSKVQLLAKEKHASFQSLSVGSEAPRSSFTSPISVAAGSPSFAPRTNTGESNLGKLLRSEIEEDATTNEGTSASEDNSGSADQGSLAGAEEFFVGNPFDTNCMKNRFMK